MTIWDISHIIEEGEGHVENFEVIFFEKENGECPVEAFILSLDVKMQAKLVGLLEILQERGNALREPYSKHLEDGIFELRCKVGSNITRVLYFFCCGGKIVINSRRKTPCFSYGDISRQIF